jgi:Zn-dependent peptidase ImmA (M78 family)/transcriptional regulator with XRE-family HTH domain
MAATEAHITGDVLRWALDDAGLSREEAADRLSVAKQLVDAWISEDRRPSKTHLDALAKLINRPPSFLFLPRPPARQPLVASFRTRPVGGNDISTETAEGLRLAERVQKIVRWIRTEADEPSPQLPIATITDDPELVGNDLRYWLGWSFHEQTRAGTTDASVSQALRSSLQDSGLLALNLTLDPYVVRGFSLPNPIAPLVAVNTRDPHRARIFSYVHELGHLSIKSDSVCLTSENDGMEAWCNKVAAATLLPRPEFTQFVQSRFPRGTVSTTEQVSSLRNHLHLSMRAIAIRLEALGLGAPGLYRLVDKEAEFKRKGGQPDPERVRTKPRVRLHQLGRGYVNSLTDAEDGGVLRRTQVLDLLRISDAELSSIRMMAASGAEG